MSTDQGKLKAKLFRAVKKGAVDQVREVLAAGLHVQTVNGNKWTALHEAARYGHVEIVELLLAAGADPNTRHRQLAYTPLYVATFEAGRASVVRALLQGGAAPSLAMPTGYTPFTNTAKRQDLEAMEILLRGGAMPELAWPIPTSEVLALVAAHRHASPQTPDEAEAAAAKTFVAPPPAPHKEAKPLRLEKVRLTGEPIAVADAAFEALLSRTGALPQGYRAFMETVGPGTLDNHVRVYGPDAILARCAEWRQRIAEHWFWGDGLLSAADAQASWCVADTIGGAELVFHPREADTLLLLPHESEEVQLVAKRGLLTALRRLLGRARRGGTPHEPWCPTR